LFGKAQLKQSLKTGEWESGGSKTIDPLRLLLYIVYEVI